MFEVMIGKPWVNEEIIGSLLLTSNSSTMARDEAMKEGVDIYDLSLSESLSYMYKFQIKNGFFYRVSEFLLDVDDVDGADLMVIVKNICNLLFFITDEVGDFKKNSDLDLPSRYPVEIDFSPLIVGSKEKSSPAEFRETYFKTYHFIRGA